LIVNYICPSEILLLMKICHVIIFLKVESLIGHIIKSEIK